MRCRAPSRCPEFAGTLSPVVVPGIVGNDGTRRTVRGRSTRTLTCLTGMGGTLLARGGVGNRA